MIAQPPVRTVAPAEAPVSLPQMRLHLRVTDSTEDSLIGTYIDAATGHLDGAAGILGRCLVTQTWQLKTDGFPAVEFDLPFPDVQSVTVSYRIDGVATTLASSVYTLSSDAGGSVVALADGAAWPATDVRPDAVTITMVCGYGAAADVPAALRAAIMMHVESLFNVRDAMGDGPPMAHAALIAPYRRLSF